MNDGLNVTRVSDALLAAIVEGAGVGIAVIDTAGGTILVNRHLAELLEYSKEELLLMSPTQVTHPDDVSLDKSLFEEVVAGRLPHYTIEKRYIRKDGSLIWAKLTVSIVRESSTRYAVAVVEDITEKKRLEEAAEGVRRAHDRYELASRATNDVIWDWDAEHATIVWNEALRTMFGYEPSQIDNRLQWWDSRIHPDDRERVVAGINRIIENGGTSWTDEYRFERADGTFAEVLDRGYISRSADGKPLRMIGAMLDVTERKRAERTATIMAEASAVLASSLDYRTTLERVARLFVPRLADWCVVDLRTGDDTYERVALIHSNPDREDRVREIRSRWPPQKSAFDPARHVITTGEVLVQEAVTDDLLEQIAQSPEHYAALRSVSARSFIVAPIAAPDSRPLGAITLAMSESGRTLSERDLPTIEDIAHRAAIAMEHARLYAEAQKANLAKDEFLATLSHELRTPLTAILGWSGVLMRPDLDPEEFVQGLDTIRRSAISQAQLIDDVLDVSRVTTGKLRLDVKPTSLGEILNDALSAVQLAADARRIEITRPAVDVVAPVIGDANRLQQVLWNLLTNAIKFTPSGGRVSVEVEQTENTIRLTVADTGRGIEADFLPYVFDPFRQQDSATTRTHGGLGLGLAIVRYFVEAHGGTVRAHSDGPNMGARFVVELPLASSPLPDGVDSTRESRPPGGVPAGELSGVHVLFVDDQADARELARVVFSRSGADVTIAGSAREALHACENRKVDVLVSDIAMPEIDGYMLIAEVRRLDATRGGHTPAIAATAYGSPADRERVLASGFDAYLRKPMDSRELVDAVARLTTARQV